MSRPTVFYARKTLVLWIAGVSIFWVAALGFFFTREMDRLNRGNARHLARVRALSKESARMRQENRMLKVRAEGLKIKIENLAAARRAAAPPPKLEVEETPFPVGRAVEVVPGRLFVTAARIEGGRVRVRLAALEDGKQANRSRTLSPGEAWRIAYAGADYVLLLHGIESSPPAARISVRRFVKKK